MLYDGPVHYFHQAAFRAGYESANLCFVINENPLFQASFTGAQHYKARFFSYNKVEYQKTYSEPSALSLNGGLIDYLYIFALILYLPQCSPPSRLICRRVEFTVNRNIHAHIIVSAERVSYDSMATHSHPAFISVK